VFTERSTGLERILAGVASLFQMRPPAPRRVSWEFFALFAIVLAGAAVRFWGLGSWGLENDEDSMAMTTMHIVHHGTPVLPSGMTYVRAIFQIYLMAASVLTGAHV